MSKEIKKYSARNGKAFLWNRKLSARETSGVIGVLNTIIDFTDNEMALIQEKFPNRATDKNDLQKLVIEALGVERDEIRIEKLEVVKADKTASKISKRIYDLYTQNLEKPEIVKELLKDGFKPDEILAELKKEQKPEVEKVESQANDILAQLEL